MAEHVFYGFLSANLFDGWDGDEVDAIDVRKSTVRFSRCMERELATAFPGAEIETDWQDGAGGSVPRPLLPKVDGWNDHEDMYIVDDIAARVYQDFESWVVYEDSGD